MISREAPDEIPKINPTIGLKHSGVGSRHMVAFYAETPIDIRRKNLSGIYLNSSAYAISLRRENSYSNIQKTTSRRIIIAPAL